MDRPQHGNYVCSMATTERCGQRIRSLSQTSAYIIHIPYHTNYRTRCRQSPGWQFLTSPADTVQSWLPQWVRRRRNECRCICQNDSNCRCGLFWHCRMLSIHKYSLETDVRIETSQYEWMKVNFSAYLMAYYGKKQYHLTTTTKMMLWWWQRLW